MIAELLVAFFFALILGLALWALFGLLLLPVFDKDMVTLLFSSGDGGSLEAKIRGFGWLREEKEKGGRLVIVDCGLTQQGLYLVQRLREKYTWLDYCPNQALPDYIELLQHCLENEKELL